MNSAQLRKNLLDLEHTRALQYFTTTIILIFTYIAGVIIALLTKQVDYADERQRVLFFFITFVVLGLGIFFLQRFRQQLRTTIGAIRRLKA